jgi:hypothetical protein
MEGGMLWRADVMEGSALWRGGKASTKSRTRIIHGTGTRYGSGSKK